jgi:transposase-like protein
VRRGREFWRGLVEEVEAGERVVDVARRHHVQPGTLSWWRWKLRGTRREPLLLPVVVRPSTVTESADAIEIRVADLSIRVRSGSDVAYIAALVAALRP